MKREREKHITRLHIILFALVLTIGIIVIVAVRSGGSKKLARYKKLEKDLKTATVYYFGNKTEEIEKGRREIVNMKTLVSNGYLQDEITNECLGYTEITNYRDLDGKYNIEYESFIKCGDKYKTEGYEEALENE